MSEWITKLLGYSSLETPWQAQQKNSWYCLIDSIRQPSALEELYKVNGVKNVQRLFVGTPFEKLSDVSPLWIELSNTDDGLKTAAKLCIDNRSGILIVGSNNPEKDINHARSILEVETAEYGKSLARFYDPALWCALGMTNSREALLGSWLAVFTPPAHEDDKVWRSWDIRRLPSSEAPLLRISSDTLDAVEAVRWWYWIRNSHPENSHKIPDSALPLCVSNLNILVSHGINEGRHLDKLIINLSKFSINERFDIKRILESNLSAYQKVRYLEALA